MASDEKKILLVEDEKTIRDAVAAYLEREGYIVRGVGDGQSAVEEFEKHSFDLVILDLMLPKLSGERVCRSIRETSNVPIIMLTAKGEVEDRIIGLELGADDYMAKPFSMRELLARIWGYEYYGDTRTVDVHIRHLRSKLASAPEIAKAIETVRGVGYRFQYEEAGK